MNKIFLLGLTLFWTQRESQDNCFFCEIGWKLGGVLIHLKALYYVSYMVVNNTWLVLCRYSSHAVKIVYR